MLLSFVPDCESIRIPLHSSPLIHSTRRGSENRIYSVEIENLISGFNRACLMDLKLGTQLYGTDATEEKKLKMVLKAQVSGSFYNIRFQSVCYPSVEFNVSTLWCSIYCCTGE